MAVITPLMQRGLSATLSASWLAPRPPSSYQNNIESRSKNSMRPSARLKPEQSMTRLMRKWNTMLLWIGCAMLALIQLTGCASSHPLPVVQCQAIPAPPAMAMKKYKPVYRQKLHGELLESAPSATK